MAFPLFVIGYCYCVAYCIVYVAQPAYRFQDIIRYWNFCDLFFYCACSFLCHILNSSNVASYNWYSWLYSSLYLLNRRKWRKHWRDWFSAPIACGADSRFRLNSCSRRYKAKLVQLGCLGLSQSLNGCPKAVCVYTRLISMKLSLLGLD